MVLHNQYPWDRSAGPAHRRSGELRDEDYVVVFHPRNRDVLDFIRRAKRGGTARPASRLRDVERWCRRRRPSGRTRRCDVRERFSVLPKLEALAVVKGEQSAPTTT